MTRAIVVAVALLGAGCGGSSIAPGGSGGSPATSQAATTKPGVLVHRCTAVSGDFRACTVFHGRGELSRIEHRDGSRWSVLLAPGRAPFPGHGWWRRILAAPGGRVLLAQWSGECETPFTYLIATRSLELRQVFRRHPVSVLGWTGDGLARVKLWQPIRAAKAGARFPSGIYLVTPRGHPVRLDRRLPPDQ